ncbi:MULTISPECIES: AAA family ATPase [unclassified Microcoleus]|uniref:AAA family ATPase n=1 Tax=unclassified Microcoleus TaxID=2642155 RepID=UPI002FD52A5B
MIQRLYINNFRCLENFELKIQGMPSALLIGKNGAGKSTIASALEVLQKISRGINRMRELEKLKLISPKDFARGRSDVPIRFEIEVLLEDKLYKYILAFDLPEKFNLCWLLTNPMALFFASGMNLTTIYPYRRLDILSHHCDAHLRIADKS